MMSGAAGHGSRCNERIENGFLRSVRHGLEEKVDPVLVEHAAADKIRLLVMRDHVRGGESERDVAAAVTPERTQAREPDAGAADDAPELAIAERDIRRRNDDDRTLLGLMRSGCCPGRRDNSAVGQAQVAGAAEIGQDRARRDDSSDRRVPVAVRMCRCRP